MSEENVETAQRIFASFNRRDREAWLRDNDPDHEVFSPKEWPENEPIRGAEACWDFYVENTGAFEDGDFDLPEVVDAGDNKVVANQRREMRGRSSGRQHRLRLLGGDDVPRWKALTCPLVLRPSRSPRSRRTVGVARSIRPGRGAGAAGDVLPKWVHNRGCPGTGAS